MLGEKPLKKNKETICLNSKGGRNGIDGLQPSLKDRVYDPGGLACAIATSTFFMPIYLVGGSNENQEIQDTRKCNEE